MELGRAVRTVWLTYRLRIAEVLPFYLLGLAIPIIVRVISFTGGVIALAHLTRTNRIQSFLVELEAVGEPPEPSAGNEALLTWFESVEPAVQQLITPTSVGVLAAAFALSAVAAVVCNAIATAGQLGACYSSLTGVSGLTGGLQAMRDYWFGILGLYMLEFLLWAVLTATMGGLIAGSARISLGFGLVIGVILLFVWLGIGIIVRGLFAFAPVAMIVEDTGVWQSVRSCVQFARGDFRNVAAYVVIAGTGLLGWVTLSSTIAILGAMQLAGVGAFLLLFPALHLLKTTMYGDYRVGIQRPEPVERSLSHQCRAGAGRSIRELSQFVRTSFLLVVLAFGVMVVGFGLGLRLADPLIGLINTSIEHRIADVIPPFFAMELFGNNWRLSMSTAFSGLALAIPAAASLMFNGIVFGMLAQLEESLAILIAFVIPHGIIEIPAIVISGALGFELGVVSWQGWWGKLDRQAIGAALEEAFWIVIGLGIILAIAALIEAFVSPWYWRLFF